jgi:hypothetical protein
MAAAAAAVAMAGSGLASALGRAAHLRHSRPVSTPLLAHAGGEAAGAGTRGAGTRGAPLAGQPAAALDQEAAAPRRSARLRPQARQ